MVYVIAAVAPALAFVLCLMPSGSARGGTLDATRSFLELKVAAVPPLRTRAVSSHASLTGGATRITEASGVFEIDDYAIESAVFTGLPMLTGFAVDLEGSTGSYTAAASYPNPMGGGVVSGFGGPASFTGAAILGIAGFDVSFHAAPLGVGGTTLAVVLNNQIFVTGAPFNTGAVQITGITSPVVFAPSLGLTGVAYTLNLTTVQLMTAIALTIGGESLFTHTVTVGGSNELDATAQSGEIRLVAPIRIRTPSDSKPAALKKTLRFVPEPMLALQLLGCAAGLVGLARVRAR